MADQMTTVVIALKIIIFFSVCHSTKGWPTKLIGFHLQHLSRTFLSLTKNIRLFLTRIDLMVPRINNNIQRKRREMGNIRIFLLSRNGT